MKVCDYVCSECDGTVTVAEELDDHNGEYYDELPDYCPSCGGDPDYWEPIG